MTSLWWSLSWLALLIPAYAYAGYPAMLRLIKVLRGRPAPLLPLEGWPSITLTLPVYNESRAMRGTLERWLACDYPRERLQILVISDASTDGTDEIVKAFASRGVELIRLPERRGKTAAENAAIPHLRGEIVVNSDASVRVPPGALKQLVASFGDPTVGVASGRDVSVENVESAANAGESGYVGYEMAIRRWETRVAGIIGASGCFYAIRRHLCEELIPEGLSRDFAAPLVAREHGYRSVSVDEAVAFVPRAASLRPEYRRKVRTMSRGMQTLWYKKRLMNPLRYGLFAWELLSHKLARWLVPWAGLLLVAALVALAPGAIWARWALTLVALTALAAVLGALWPPRPPMPRVIAVPAYFLAANVATLHAWIKALSGASNPIWEPTRRTP